MSTPRTVQQTLHDGETAFREFLTAVIINGHAQAEAAGLGATDFFALNLLGALGPLTASELAEQTGLTSGATTRLIDRLERAGQVRRKSDNADRRRVTVHPTPAHKQDSARVVSAARAELAEIFRSYRVDQLDTLFDFFTRATPALRRAAKATRTPGRPADGRAADPLQEGTE